MKKYKKINIFRDSGLPDDGWFQSCFSCHSVTSNIIKYKKIKTVNYTYEIGIYVCPTCKETFKNNKKLQRNFLSKCNNYIKNKLIII